MNKRGQFYIIAAILIVMVLFGLASVSTYTIVKPEPKTIYDLSKDLDRESYKVLEYGIYNKENLTNLSESFSGEDVAKYFLKKTDNANIGFVYGDKNDLNFLTYNHIKTGGITVGGSRWEAYKDYSKKRKADKKKDFKKVNGQDFIKVRILEKDHLFELRDNEMFYFIIVKKRGDELFVERN